ncbi:hypothetical protein L227DRAFT_59407 [Lentinus tigrinus ALCF2SS1-6]|uniref:Uncharacterized protein n=1 Tax=Lentinus tigrinus ALCF2SS1-6 TaxID=1328759 RepID=A0A5C2SDD5_9APHY|nr:hypothetical protein L227DRAFT_59407 [Lentinus tigrinus ALCF2SS1-6]
MWTQRPGASSERNATTTGWMWNLEDAKGITYVPVEPASGLALLLAAQAHGPQIPNSDVQRSVGMPSR